MSSDLYKVFFKGHRMLEEEELTLTFKGVISDKPIKIPRYVFLNLKKLSETKANIIAFQNIEDIIIVGRRLSQGRFTSFSVLLFTSKSNEVKEGFLIGKDKKLGNVLIGIWYFNTQNSAPNNKKILEKCQDLLDNSDCYSNITLIY